MSDPWFRRVPTSNGSSRYKAVDWRGSVLIVAAVLLCLVPMLVPGLSSAGRLIAFVLWLPLVLIGLSRLVRSRS